MVNAWSSPKVIISNSFEKYCTVITPVNTIGKSIITLDQSFSEKLPICQNVSRARWSLANAIIRVSMALTNNEKTMPTKIIVLVSKFLSIIAANFTAAKTVAMPNIKPVAGRVKNPSKGILKPVTITIAAPKEAPEDTPKV